MQVQQAAPGCRRTVVVTDGTPGKVRLLLNLQVARTEGVRDTNSPFKFLAHGGSARYKSPAYSFRSHEDRIECDRSISSKCARLWL